MDRLDFSSSSSSSLECKCARCLNDGMARSTRFPRSRSSTALDDVLPTLFADRKTADEKRLGHFFVSLTQYCCHYNRIEQTQRTTISLLYASIFSSVLLTNSTGFLSKYPLFSSFSSSSLCLIKLCVNCVRFHQTSLSVSACRCSDAV